MMSMPLELIFLKTSYYLRENIMRLLDKDQLADVMYGNNLCLLHESHESYKHHLAT